MVWEDIEHEERELLDESDHDTRLGYYRALSHGLIYYVLVLVLALILMSIAIWLVFT